MSEGSPSLEEDPKPLINSLERNVFTPKLTTPIFAGSVKLVHRGSDFADSETESFLTDAQRNEFALQELLSYGDGGFDKAERETEGRDRDIQAMSVLSTYRDNMSREMNTERDNVSDASTREAEECGCGDQPGMDLHHLKSKSNGKPTTCSIMMSGFKTNPTLLFNDGKRTIDFVLVYDTSKEEEMKPEIIEFRRVFEKNLEDEGLELERDSPPELLGLSVVKIHAPLLVLRDYGELLKLRMPMKFSALKDISEKSDTVITRIKGHYHSFMEKFYLDPDIFPERRHRLTAIYSKDKEYLFDTQSDCFWTPSNRSRIVRFILDRKKFSESSRDEFAFGISRLVANQGYSAAYALHDGDLKTPGSMRHLLYTEWASLHRLHKMQPLDYIKDYFGVKIGLYFAWLGFYTYMLLPASLIGLLSVIYSVATVFSNEPSNQVCNYNSSIIMCPLCDYHCDYWDLKDTCLQFRVTYLFDNITTVIFAIVMSFWAAVFLELWKRYSAEMAHRWDLTGFDMYEEHPRPQYLARLAHVRRTQLNVVTGQREPMVPFWRMRLPIALLSFSVVGLLVLMAIATVLGVVFYRMSLMGALMFQSTTGALITSNPVMFTSATAALINLCFIFVFNYIYQYLAVWLTEKELLRTQSEFEDSLTVKNYLLEFVNYYASIFYIAFFKGKHVGRPGNYIRLFGQRQEECPPGGCLLELSIQLAIIMIGKQCLNAALELLTPYLKRWYNIMTNMGKRRNIKSKQQWVQDFKLVDMGEMGLFAEYLEMVLQYGFVTIFVAAFPLAPFFALINNIFEMRLDAKKFLVQYRRPVPQRVSDIGVWYPILDSIGKLSIITNGFIIAFTSEFIPRLVYLYQNGNMNQFVNHTLTDFNITVLEHPPRRTEYTQTMCSFPGYWDPGVNSSYEHASSYWHIIGARLAFVVVFENVVALLIMIVKWAIPDISGDLRDRIRRETYVINQFIIEETHARHAMASCKDITKNRSSVSFNEQTGPMETVAQTHWNALLTASLDDFDLATNVDSSNIGDLTRRMMQKERGDDGGEQDVHQKERDGECHDGPTYV